MLIGEVSRRSGVSARMLRHYDALGLVTPTGRTSGGYREYSPDDIRRLFHVESLRTLGLSLEDTKRALDEPEFAPSALVGDLIRHTRRRIAAEQELLAKLERVDDAGPTLWDDVLRVVGLLHALDSESAGRRQQAVLSQDPGPRCRSQHWSKRRWRRRTRMWRGRCSGRWRVPPIGDFPNSPPRSTRRRSRSVGAPPPRSRRFGHPRRPHSSDGCSTIRTPRSASGPHCPWLPRRHRAIPTLMTMIVDGRSDVEAAEVLAGWRRAPRIPTTSPGWCTTRSTTPTTRPRACESRRRWPRFRRNRPGDPRPARRRPGPDRCRDRCGDPGSARPRQRATSTSALTAPRRAVRR